MAVGTRMQQRRATAAVWNVSNYILAAGEIGMTTDTAVFKWGDGVNVWSALPVAFEGQYLSLAGTAANSALLGGVSVNSLVKIADTDVNPTNNTYVKRTADGGVKATDATENTEVTTLQQQTAAITESRKIVFSRTITATATLALTDIGKTIAVNNASTTAQLVVTIPRNSDVAFPIGSYVDVMTVGVGGAKLVPIDGTVGTNGRVNVLPSFGVVRLFKNDTNNWIGMDISRQGRLPTFKIRRTVAGDNYGSAYQFVPFDTVDTAGTYNPDNEWFSIPASGMATARRIIVNKDGEYEFTAAMATNGTGGLTYCRITSMTADNSTTGMKPFAVQSMTAVAMVTASRRVVAGESFGVHHGFVAGNLGKADAEATGGDPHYFRIVRLGD